MQICESPALPPLAAELVAGAFNIDAAFAGVTGTLVDGVDKASVFILATAVARNLSSILLGNSG